MFIVKYGRYNKNGSGDFDWYQLNGFFTRQQAQTRANELLAEDKDCSAHVVDLSIEPGVRYMLFIDGVFKKAYSTLEEAKKNCYCGDVFNIYEAKHVHKEVTPSMQPVS